MASSVSYDFRPTLRTPVLIEGLPGVGNVGKLAADILARQLGAVRYARIYSDDLPPQVLLDGDCVADAARCELWVADIGERDVVFLLGDFQGTTPAGQYNLSEKVFRMVLPYDPSMVITLGGYGTGQLPPAPRVLGAVSDPSLKPSLEAAGVGCAVIGPGTGRPERLAAAVRIASLCSREGRAPTEKELDELDTVIAEGTGGELLDRTTQALYSPGSSFKAVTSLACEKSLHVFLNVMPRLRACSFTISATNEWVKYTRSSIVKPAAGVSSESGFTFSHTTARPSTLLPESLATSIFAPAKFT